MNTLPASRDGYPEFYEHIKAALDPNHILAPGRYEHWREMGFPNRLAPNQASLVQSSVSDEKGRLQPRERAWLPIATSRAAQADLAYWQPRRESFPKATVNTVVATLTLLSCRSRPNQRRRSDSARRSWSRRRRAGRTVTVLT